MHKNIVQQIQEIKAMGFLVKIDTNGSNSAVLKQLIDENLIDYVALDFKATKEKFQEITKSELFQPFEKSFEILLENTIQFEIRTTYHSDLISNSEMNEMVSYLDAKKYTGNYYVQSFKNNVATLGDLNSSVRIKENEFSSESNFNVIFRN
jgi:pyruvate formate lyase activating enzyme